MARFSYRRINLLDSLIPLWSYEGVIRKAILALKYKFTSDIASELADACVSRIGSFSFLNYKSTLIPIPLHWRRSNWRGFNQSELIGKLIAKKMAWDFTPDLLIRKFNTVPQAELDRGERIGNLRNAFSLNRRYNTKLLNSRIIIFDDVYTTGTTMSEATRVLKSSGVKKVLGLTIAG